MTATTFSGKICVVTGAASGLGLEICRQLAAAGAVLVMADLDQAGLTRAAEALVAGGAKAKAAPTDVTDPNAVKALIEGAHAEFGRIDYLFNNAGIGGPGEIRDVPLEHWRRTMEVNLFGVIHGIHYAYPLMIAQGFGHIVNTASAAGLAPAVTMAPYVGSKFAVVGISHVLAAEARDLGVFVTAVCPGFIDTPILNQSAFGADAADIIDQLPVRVLALTPSVEKILDGVARRKVIVAFPFYVHALVFLFRFMPALSSLLSRRSIREFRKSRGAPQLS